MTDLLDEVDSREGIRLAGNVLDLLGTVLTERLDCVPQDPDIAHRAASLGEAAIWARADVTSSAQVKSAVAAAAEAFGRLDVVVANAGPAS